jgi:hypothetical protein
MYETQKTETTTLFRIENPVHPKPRTPDGVVSHEDLVGQWFTPNLDKALSYLPKSTQTFGRCAAPVDGAQLVVAHVPEDQLDGLHVSRHPIAASMDVENDNYIVPRDGSVPTDVIPLDETIAELRGQLGNFNKQREARERVHAMLGGVAVEK